MTHEEWLTIRAGDSVIDRWCSGSPAREVLNVSHALVRRGASRHTRFAMSDDLDDLANAVLHTLVATTDRRTAASG